MKSKKTERKQGIQYCTAQSSDRCAGFHLADSYCMAGMYFLQCLFRHEYIDVFPGKVERCQLCKTVSSGYRSAVSAMVHEYIHYRLFYLRDLYHVCADGSLCHVGYAFSHEKTIDESGRYPESVSGNAGYDCRVLYIKVL